MPDETKPETSNPTFDHLREGGKLELAFAQEFTVDSPEAMGIATEHLRKIAGLKKMATDIFKRSKQKADETKRAILASERAFIDPFKESDRILRVKVVDYRAFQEEQATAERRRLEALERERQETERLDRAAALENAAAATGDKFYKDAAEATLIEKPAAPIVAAVPLPKLPGVGFRKPTYDVQVTDLVQLAAAVAKGEVNVQALTPNMSWLKAEAKQRAATLGEGATLVPGVVVVKKQAGLTVRS